MRRLKLNQKPSEVRLIYGGGRLPLDAEDRLEKVEMF
jgi:hypothetical protein